MKNLSLRAALSLPALLVASPTLAQTFEGPRVEATVGWDQLSYDLGSAAGSTTERRADLGYGVAAGYDRAVSPTVIVGVEGAATFSQGDYTTAATGDTVHVRRDLSAAVRVGTRVGGNALVYGKLGYSNLQLGLDTLDATLTPTYGRRNYDGVLLGVGAEVGLTGNTYLKSEYRYTNYEDGVSRQNILTGIGIRF